jgi:hypothetical protein
MKPGIAGKAEISPRSDRRGGEYRSNARAALATAEGSPLEQVRRQQEAAASVWLMLAAYEEHRSVKARTPGAQDPGKLGAFDGEGLEFLRVLGLLGPRGDAL